MRLFHLIIISLLIYTPLKSETEIEGVINEDQRWTEENGPYVITNDLLITSEARLAITAGTHILVEKPVNYNPDISQFDHTDSTTISIRIKGVFSCIGRPERRIVFSGRYPDSSECSWYGIILDSAVSEYSEIAFTDIANACYGLTTLKCFPVIRNCLFEYNQTGLRCMDLSAPRIYNNIFAFNISTGILVNRSNPVFYNNIIAFNRNVGIFSDGISKVEIKYNCFFENRDKNFQGCSPELGILVQTNKNDDSTDYNDNIYLHPVFKGSVAESLAVESDISKNTDKSRITDTSLAKILHDSLPDSTAYKLRTGSYKRYSLSEYSPCIDAGNPKKQFRDKDKTRNDMGIWGGPEFFER